MGGHGVGIMIELGEGRGGEGNQKVKFRVGFFTILLICSQVWYIGVLLT